jgi:hypothetical protein
MKRLSRRTVLKGLLGGAAVAVALPPLEAMLNATGTAWADGGALPTRFGLFFWGNGVLPAGWAPAATGSEWALTEQLSPLEKVKHALTVVSGMKVQTANVEPHLSGAAGMLSGAPLLFEDGRATFSAPSVDQLVAKAIGGVTRFRSLEFGPYPADGYSYVAKGTRNPPEQSPRALFERLFGAGFTMPGQGGEPDPMLRLRRSVLDAVTADARALQAKLGASDRRRLDQHLTGVFELEQRLLQAEQNPPALAACAVPEAPAEAWPSVEGRPPISAKHRAMVDVAVMALACDQTRVFSDFLSGSVNNLLFPGAPAGHHQLTHDEPGDQPNVHAIVKQIIAEFAYLLERLDAVPEGDGTLLDHTVVMGTSDCSFGRTHALDEYPILLAGSAGGRLKTGQHYRSVSGENASRVLLSLVRALDVPLPEIGLEEGRATDGLGAIES